MAALLQSRLAHLSTSFFLFLLAVPLISIGTTSGPRLLLWIGVAALCIGGFIPPVQRLVARRSTPAAKPDGDSSD